MNIITQYNLMSNPNYKNYLKENSSWYKYLNRNRSYFKDFDYEVKKRYKLRTEDKLDKMRETVDTISKFMDILN